jgi:hypothetical protein
MKGALLALMFAGLILSACADGGPFIGDNDRAARLEDAKARRERWMRERPLHYEIRYLMVEGGPGTAESYRFVKIRNSSVLDTTCPNGPCPIAHLKHVRQVHEVYDLIIEDDPDCEVKAIYRNDINIPSLVTRVCTPGTKADFSLAITAFSATP